MKFQDKGVKPLFTNVDWCFCWYPLLLVVELAIEREDMRSHGSSNINWRKNNSEEVASLTLSWNLKLYPYC